MDATRRCEHHGLRGVELLEDRCMLSSYYVAVSGKDTNSGTIDRPFATINHALVAASQPGDQVLVREGAYREQIVIPHGGNTQKGNFTLKAYSGEHVVLSGSGFSGGNMILLKDLSYVHIEGFEITGLANITDGSGIRVLGGGSTIELVGNTIHKLRGQDAMGITVYGASDTAISNLLISGNEIYDCQAADSEALTLNGNITSFRVLNNRIHDVNGAGIGATGGDRSVNATQLVRNGLIRGNTVYHARSNSEGSLAAGICIDSGKDITVENNICYENDVGLKVDAETRGLTSSGIVVQNNVVYRNEKAGLEFGGAAATNGRVTNSTFRNNTVYQNDAQKSGHGQLWIQYASSNTVTNNIFVAASNNVLIASTRGNTQNTLDNNLYYAVSASANIQFTWNGIAYRNFSTYRMATRQDAASVFTDPKLVKPAVADFHLAAGSPAIDSGSVTVGRFASLDFEGRTRPLGKKSDPGAYEYQAANSAPTIICTIGKLGYSRSASAVAVDSRLTIADRDSTTLEKATISITNGYLQGKDRLQFTNQSGITGTWNAKTGVLTLTGKATLANYQTALRSVKFVTTAVGAKTATRTISWVANDGSTNSTAATRTVAVGLYA